MDATGGYTFPSRPRGVRTWSTPSLPSLRIRLHFSAPHVQQNGMFTYS